MLSNSASNCEPSPVDRWAAWTQVMHAEAGRFLPGPTTDPAQQLALCTGATAGDFDCAWSWHGGGVEVAEFVGETLVESRIGRADRKAAGHFEILTRNPLVPRFDGVRMGKAFDPRPHNRGSSVVLGRCLVIARLLAR